MHLNLVGGDSSNCNKISVFCSLIVTLKKNHRKLSSLERNSAEASSKEGIKSAQSDKRFEGTEPVDQEGPLKYLRRHH
jgi:hypothetical protein